MEAKLLREAKAQKAANRLVACWLSCGFLRDKFHAILNLCHGDEGGLHAGAKNSPVPAPCGNMLRKMLLEDARMLGMMAFFELCFHSFFRE